MRANHKAHVAKTEIQVTKKLCQELDTPRALSVYLLLKNNQIKDAMSLPIDPLHYNDVNRFRDDYFITKVLSKSVSQDLSIDRKEVAFQKWLAAEQQCYETNNRLRAFSSGLCNPLQPEIREILDRTRALISSLVGPLTSSTLAKIEDSFNFGPGATTGVSGIVTYGKKFSRRTITTSERLLSFGLFCLPDLWKENVKGFRVRNSSKLRFVPKNALTDRAIAIENDLNIYVQKGIGAVLQQKLANWGIDLRHQAGKNADLASRCYRTGGCTIDLSSASDTVSYMTILELFPPDWMELLHFCRSDFCQYEGIDLELHKWSSMGNGYTFELETIIFYCITLACKQLYGSSHPIATFGDDIICGLDIQEYVVNTLNFLGFSVNSEKSFGNSAFHESCGSDYFLGVNVRPIFLRFDDYDAPKETHCYLYANLVRYWAYCRNGSNSCDVRCLPAWLYCFTAVPKSLRLRVPTWDYAVGGFVGSFDECRPYLKRGKRGWDGFLFGYRHRPSVERTVDMMGAYISSLRNGSDFTRGREALRDRFRPPKTRRGHTLVWPLYGEWL